MTAWGMGAAAPHADYTGQLVGQLVRARDRRHSISGGSRPADNPPLKLAVLVPLQVSLINETFGTTASNQAPQRKERKTPMKNCSANDDAFQPPIMGGMTVTQAAHYIGCSTRRVRVLLAEGRLAGEKNGKLWRVTWPLRYTLATRGPLLKVNRMYGHPRPTRGRSQAQTGK